MTRFSVGPDEFLKHLEFATRISEKSALPETEYITVDCTTESVRLFTESMISRIATTAHKTVTVDTPGTFVVNAARLARILRGSSQKITFATLDDLSVIIDVGAARWTMPQLEYKFVIPEWAKQTTLKSAFDGMGFVDALSRCRTVVGTDPTRWAYQQIVLRDGSLVASDGVQYFKQFVDKAAPDMALPSIAVRDLLNMTHLVDKDIFEYQLFDNEHVFKNGNTRYSVVGSSYEFPVDDMVFRAAKVGVTEANTFMVFADDLNDGLEAVGRVSPQTIMVGTDDDTIVVDALGEDHAQAIAEVKAAGKICEGAGYHVQYAPLQKFFARTHDSLRMSFLPADGAALPPLRVTDFSGQLEYVLFQTVAD